jgi:hypothetical protein
VMLDGMCFEELQKQFDVPLYAFDFSALAGALKSGFKDVNPGGLGTSSASPIRGHHTVSTSSF